MPLIKNFVLASESPRRQQLLREAGFVFTVFPLKVSENLEKNLNARNQIQAISRHKWQAAQQAWNQTKVDEALLLTADTMVVFKGQALGKPQDSADAIKTLATLSGNRHQVITALTLGLSTQTTPFEDFEETHVFFRPISRQEILDYVQTGEPLDKAGSYAIQGGGKQFVTEIQGDYDNVVGLSLSLLKKMLLAHDWQLPRSP